MLRIKRASAGSGKTYELAKFFIKLLITTKQQGKKRLLLKDESFKETLSSIMAVTFTVKATAEMKQRIVEKLADLSRAGDPALSDDDLKEIDYLEEFTSDLKTDRFRIAELAGKALRTLLLNYSDFKVQTIDSFFQSILHTFVYEASLDDNFNTEINTDLVTAVGLGTALDDLSESGDPELLHWLRKVMDKDAGSNHWNVFTRDESSRSVYSSLIREAKNLEKEEYLKYKEKIFEYFNAPGRRPMREIVEEIDADNLLPWRDLHESRREKALRLKEILTEAGLYPTDLTKGSSKVLEESLTELDIDNFRGPSKTVRSRGGKKDKSPLRGRALGEKQAKAFLESAGQPEAVLDAIDEAFDEWAAANNAYFDAFSPYATGVNTWIAYRALLPNLMVVLEIARRKEAYLAATNSLQISDTSHILSQIIGDDDAPFVYERMGSRISHYLIDEFQDTSYMQWRNLKPLIDESESSGNDNLIIGDAKQSIYRFRNADYTIIAGLEDEFEDIAYHTRESDPKDNATQNTNFRSMRKVVEFNNYVFSNIVNLGGSKGDPYFSAAAKEVYADCEQALPKEKEGKKKPDGYVEVDFYPSKSSTPDDEKDESYLDDARQLGFAELPERIMELRSRGYDFGDIGILVKKHDHGFAAVNVISAYNSAHPESAIPVISEEDLLVGGALSVRIIIRALEMAATGGTAGNKGLPSVLPDPIGERELFEMLRQLNTLALPSVTEAIIATFIPSGLRAGEAPFLAAFQDAVLEYCSGRPGDIGAFLKWWKTKSKSLSITSPEGSKGVKLQTIHKAKGLEFKCVIIPMANFIFTPGSLKEWRWVEVADCFKGHKLLPPYLPVSTGGSLENSAHAAELKAYKEAFALDELNKMYVAFTRAVDELYIYVPTSQKDGANAANTLKKLLEEGEADITGNFIREKSEGGRRYVRYGTPLTPEEIAEEKRRKAEKESRNPTETLELPIYSSSPLPFPTEEEETSERKSLLFRNDNPLKTIIHPDGREEEIDPRAEGTLKHRIMQMVQVPSDLEKALKRMKVEGMISRRQADDWGAELRKALESVEDQGWFAPGLKVYVERALLFKGMKKVPDRMMVSPEGDAVVVDYKFGAEEDEKYDEQIGKYASWLRQTGTYRSVKAFIWYVSRGDIVEI